MGSGVMIPAASAKVQRIWIEVVPDLSPDASYLEQEGWEDRLEQYRSGQFFHVGVRVCAEILIPVNNQLIGQVVKSPGLWGIEDDSSEGYLRDVASDELSTLREMLDALHVPFFAGDGMDYTDCRIEWQT